MHGTWTNTGAIGLLLWGCGGGVAQTESAGDEPSTSTDGESPAEDPPERAAEPLRGTPIERVALPEGPWLASFRTGEAESERLWLLPEQGEPVDVTIAEEPNARAWISFIGGNDDGWGRVGDVAYDASRRELFCVWAVADEYELRSLHLATGQWTRWLRHHVRPRLDWSSRRGLVLFPQLGQSEVQAELDGRFVPIPFDGSLLGEESEGDAPPLLGEGVDILHSRVTADRDVALIAGQVFEAEGGSWEPSAVGAAAPEDVWIAQLHPSGSHACGHSSRGTWLFGSGVATQLDVDQPGRGCRFTPDGGHVYAPSGYGRSAVTHFFDLEGAKEVDYPTDIQVWAYRDGVLYASVEGGVGALDPESLAFEMLSESPIQRTFSEPQVRALGEALLVSYVTAVRDEDSLMRHFVLPRDGGEHRHLPEAGERFLYDFVQLSDGGALFIARDNGLNDRVRRLDAQGNSSDIGPFDGIDERIHGLVLLD